MDELQNDEDSESSPRKRPNPNNPMEYCSTVPPPLQINSSGSQPPPSVMVPVGVLKREGEYDETIFFFFYFYFRLFIS